VTAQPLPTWHPSPNFGPRRDDLKPCLVVLHYTNMARCADALARLCDPEAEVSSHYLISETGHVWQMVEEDQRAWHAGAGQWRGVADINSRSIGIELSNTGKMPFPEPQMVALDIPADGVIGHSDMAPSRKTDPGPRFDWRRLALAGLSVWPDARVRSDADFFPKAVAFGYPDTDGEDAVLHAFRQRFRPSMASDGSPADATDKAMIADLADRFPVDRPWARA
jgi:N-acetylmuramoyl-L-alanine amidase